MGEYIFDAVMSKHLIFPAKIRTVAINKVTRVVDFITKSDDTVSELAGCGLGLILGRGKYFPSAITSRLFLKQTRPPSESRPGILPRP